GGVPATHKLALTRFRIHACIDRKLVPHNGFRALAVEHLDLLDLRRQLLSATHRGSSVTSNSGLSLSICSSNSARRSLRLFSCSSNRLRSASSPIIIRRSSRCLNSVAVSFNSRTRFTNSVPALIVAESFAASHGPSVGNRPSPENQSTAAKAFAVRPGRNSTSPIG